MDRLFARFANATARVAGSPYTFIVCVLLVLLWAATGPMFHYSETWQLVINTGTTIITFLMVFVIQNSQNRDGHALQTKLDELIRSSNAQDEFMGIEKLTDKELEVLHAKCEAAAKSYQNNLDKMRGEREKRSRAKASRHPAHRKEADQT